MRRFFSMTLVWAAMSIATFSFAQTASEAAGVIAAPINTLVKTDTVVGTGLTAVSGAKVSMNYTGWLYDPKAPDFHGKMFDSSAGREPLTFFLGKRMVIKGWDQGIVGMKVGGKRTLIIPSELAYGRAGAGDGLIPSNAILMFDVELLDVK